jgi:hypothetical protein
MEENLCWQKGDGGSDHRHSRLPTPERWLDAQENVDQVPAPSRLLVQWLQAFVQNTIPWRSNDVSDRGFKKPAGQVPATLIITPRKKSKGPEHDWWGFLNGRWARLQN